MASVDLQLVPDDPLEQLVCLRLVGICTLRCVLHAATLLPSMCRLAREEPGLGDLRCGLPDGRLPQGHRAAPSTECAGPLLRRGTGPPRTRSTATPTADPVRSGRLQEN